MPSSPTRLTETLHSAPPAPGRRTQRRRRSPYRCFPDRPDGGWGGRCRRSRRLPASSTPAAYWSRSSRWLPKSPRAPLPEAERRIRHSRGTAGSARAGAALAGLGQIDPPHPLAEESAAAPPRRIAVDRPPSPWRPAGPAAAPPAPAGAVLEPQGFSRSTALPRSTARLGIGQVELIGGTGLPPHPPHPAAPPGGWSSVPRAGRVRAHSRRQPPPGAAAHGGDGTAPLLGQKALRRSRSAMATVVPAPTIPIRIPRPPFFSFTPS